MIQCKSFRSEGKFCAEGAKFRKVYEGTSNFMKFRPSIDYTGVIFFSKIHLIIQRRLQCLLALSYFNIDFQEILKINEKSGLSEQGSDARDPILGHFWRQKMKKVTLVMQARKSYFEKAPVIVSKILRRRRKILRTKIAPKAQFFLSLDWKVPSQTPSQRTSRRNPCPAGPIQ